MGHNLSVVGNRRLFLEIHISYKNQTLSRLGLLSFKTGHIQHFSLQTNETLYLKRFLNCRLLWNAVSHFRDSVSTLWDHGLPKNGNYPIFLTSWRCGKFPRNMPRSLPVHVGRVVAKINGDFCQKLTRFNCPVEQLTFDPTSKTTFTYSSFKPPLPLSPTLWQREKKQQNKNNWIMPDNLCCPARHWVTDWWWVPRLNSPTDVEIGGFERGFLGFF